MTWESIIEGAFRGVSNFVNSFINVIGGSLNPAAVEGIVALFCIGIIIRLVDVGPKIPGKILDVVNRKHIHLSDDENEYEWIRVKRR